MKLDIKKFKIKLPIQLVLIIVGSLLLGDFLPIDVKRFFYTTSMTIKEILIFALPAIIFSFVFACILSLKKGSFIFVGMLLLMLTCSNMLSALVAYGTANVIWDYVAQVSSEALEKKGTLVALWSLKLPKWIPNDYALFSAMFIGAFFTIINSKKAIDVAERLKNGANFFLQKCLVPIVPLFILGFVLHLQHEGILSSVLKQYGPLLIVIVSTQLIYIFLLYGLGVRFKFRKWVQAIKNVIPSAIGGFSTMSSAAAMPLTLGGAQKNSGDPDKASAVIPITVSIHLVGCSIAIPILAICILKTFGHTLPDFSTYVVFALYFVLAKYAVAAVPGGGIIVMLPILEKYLGFNAEMLSLITTLYILFDAFVTMANVLGNGAFCVLYIKIYNWVTSSRKAEEFCKEAV